MTERLELAEKIYLGLKDKGADIGNASIVIIDSILESTGYSENGEIIRKCDCCGKLLYPKYYCSICDNDD
ncbi:MAG: hypothetical protein PHW73_00555 [Atribacterota bacterium]|nr:hypothetical protein [Atribacterota bacterium]